MSNPSTLDYVDTIEQELTEIKENWKRDLLSKYAKPEFVFEEYEQAYQKCRSRYLKALKEYNCHDKLTKFKKEEAKINMYL